MEYLGMKTIAGLALGAIAGFGYHKMAGCRSGACLITANPYVSVLYGALMGYFISAN